MPRITVWPLSASTPDAEGGVLLRETAQGQGHPVVVRPGPGLDGDLDHGLGELHPLQDHRIGGIAQGIAGGRVLEAAQGHDVSGMGLADVPGGCWRA